MTSRRAPTLLLGALSLLAALVPARAEDAAGGARVTIPFVGIDRVDPYDEAQVAAARLERVSGLAAALVRTVPIPWQRIEPHAPVMGGRHLHDWEALDRFVAAWQAVDFHAVLVLTPESSWASIPRKDTALVQAAAKALEPAEAAVLEREAVGAAPPKKRLWAAWERFVQDVAERYDHDGLDDMPGLRRRVGWIQVAEHPASPTSWTGSAQDYLRLLHHADLGAAKASPGVRIAHGAIDFHTLAYPPRPDEEGLLARLAERHVRAPAALAFEERRALEFTSLTLSLRGLFRAVPHVGSEHLADTAVDLAWTRAVVDEGAGPEAEVWLVDDPPEKHGSPSWAAAGGPDAEELRVRAQWRSRAGGTPDAEETKRAVAWLEAGRAYDLVRTLGRAREAGADRIFFGGAAGLDVFVARGGAPDGGWRRTPAWYVLRQAAHLLTGHGSVTGAGIGTTARWWRFTFPSGGSRPWVMAVALNPDDSWAGDPRHGGLAKEVAVPVPDGPYVVEQLAQDAADPIRTPVRVSGGTLTLLMTPAPVWIYPAE